MAKACYYCVNNQKPVDWQDVATLKRFVSSSWKIAPKRRSGLCSKHQRQVARAIKRARIMGLMPFVPE
jgi:small subunit ribosomal protein S18